MKPGHVNFSQTEFVLPAPQDHRQHLLHRPHVCVALVIFPAQVHWVAVHNAQLGLILPPVDRLHVRRVHLGLMLQLQERLYAYNAILELILPPVDRLHARRVPLGLIPILMEWPRVRRVLLVRIEVPVREPRVCRVLLELIPQVERLPVHRVSLGLLPME
jgi:hypothetical protein